MLSRGTAIVGVGVTQLGRLPFSAEELALTAAQAALRDAGLSATDLRQVFLSNVLGGWLCDQNSIRGQAWLRHLGLADTPVFNVENACAGGASAVHLACQAAEAGVTPILVLGVEKMYSTSRNDTLRGIEQCLPADERKKFRAAQGDEYSSLFMALNAAWAQRYIDERGGNPAHFAVAASKARLHASRNPVAQHRTLVSFDEVLTSPTVHAPLTRLMCSSLTDGAAALILQKTTGTRLPRIRASCVSSGFGALDYHERLHRTASATCKESGVGPDDVDVVELHDATSAEEIFALEALGFFPPGEAGPATVRGETTFGGTIVVNPSGGLVGRGHPIGATGICQIAEITLQLRGEAGQRQVKDARLGLAVNTGGIIAGDAASVAMHVIERGC